MSRCSGGIEGRPCVLYIVSKSGESRCSAASTIGLMRRIGWSAGTNVSGVTAGMMLAWRSASPRMGQPPGYTPTAFAILPDDRPFFSTLLS